MSPRIALTVLFAVLALRPESGLGAETERLVLVVDSGTGPSAKAAAELSPALAAALRRKGYEVLSGPEVAQALSSIERIGVREAKQICERFDAKGVLEVAVGFLLPAQAREKGPEAKAAVGLTARQLGPNGVTWRNSLSLIDDAPAPADTATRRRLPFVARASTRLLWSLPRGKGAPAISAEEDYDEVTGTVAITRNAGDYDVLLERMRAQRAGPRFRLRITRANGR